MSEATTDHIMGCLYARQPDMNLVNVKFFRGDKDLIEPNELCDQAHSASLQRKMDGDTLDGAPKTARPKMDVREFVKTL
ncbi:hypothetical protein [Mesorhizobium japonicum]|uniref:Msl1769 protein n=1 Tax=Mesorhizobium japonicum (strain LMG 29417 / CECT 9101 / MAFF 303099) TaxID=266835 RepID=Q98JU9_RHILO|nr:hypothetical protein [Mesorhizobium japonicum]BAB49066.1 msl1769 [Mesorhizobium japonicum MAFF 303099]